MPSKNKDVSVLFSGGSDSTLAAAICADQFRKVHLLNFHHSGMQQIEKSSVNVERLRKRFGKDKFIFKRLDIEELFKNSIIRTIYMISSIMVPFYLQLPVISVSLQCMLRQSYIA